MPAPPPPQSLDDLLAHAENFAGFSMRTQGRVPPTLFALCPAGPLVFTPATTADGRELDNFAYTVRLLCIVHDATAAVMIFVSRLTHPAPGLPPDLSVPPSDPRHRQEVVLLTGENRKTAIQKILPIIRTGAGAFCTLDGHYPGPPDVGFMTRFGHILPPVTVSPAMRAMAHSHLAVLGITPATIRHDWSAN